MVDLCDSEMIESFKYLIVSKEEKSRAEGRSFDGKKNCWVPDLKDCFVAAEILSEEDDLVTVLTLHDETMCVKKHDIQKMNPPKYEKCEDMADLAYLNNATVLHNLRERYLSWLIYTYSGLFCIAINPYKRLPIYTLKMISLYRGKNKVEVPPHLYLVADTAYCCMLRDRENQSMIITGESGAGKTENAKKAIQYFARIATRFTCNTQSKTNLEEQIVSANPVLEAYGNAKTTRNNNSSRFGKFIRIHFELGGNIAGADIESYLLEKSRVTFQQPAERNFHIFYQLLSPAFAELHEQLLVKPEPQDYFYIAQGMLTIDNVDDGEEMKLTDKAFDTLNFEMEEKLNLFKCTAAIMHFGNIKWKQRAREEQAEVDGSQECDNVADLLSIPASELLKGLMKPKIKVGSEYVNKGQNKEQVTNAISALCKSIYSRCFNWLVERVNETLDIKTKKHYFIGVLDIAGFEIFELNGFEQLCINFTNEKLQQFFNYHMFVLEQDEYKKEEIQWETIDFGLDLQACIDLIEKPMGIFSILEEECIVPKATDKTFREKLYRNHFGKHPHFGKTKQVKGRAETYFDLHHYAGTVSYNVTGWLEKNKDPTNPTVFALFKSSRNKLLSLLYQDIGEEEKVGKIKKKSSMQTISFCHRKQLNKLMSNLKSTHPHFVRCIIPNEVKAGGIFDAHLVLHQLHCNNVLEGIRICRKGFPSRMTFDEFSRRYGILVPKKLMKQLGDEANDSVKMTQTILKCIAFDEDFYRTGSTKVFFRTGVLGLLEDLRDNTLSKFIGMLQAHMRAYIIKKDYKKILAQLTGLRVLQKNLKQFLVVKKLWSKATGNQMNAKVSLKDEPEMKEIVTHPTSGDNNKELIIRLLEEKRALIKENAKLVQELINEKEINSNHRLESIKEIQEIVVQDNWCGKCKGDKNLKSHDELDRARKEFEDLIKRKEAETQKLLFKIENEQKSSSQLKKKCIELDQSLNEVTEEAHTEKLTKNKLHNQLARLQRDFDELNEKYEEVNGSKLNLVELNKKRESEIIRLKQDVELANLEYETSLAKIKKKHQEVINEMSDKFEQMQKSKNKFESDKQTLRLELEEAQTSNENLIKSKAVLEKNAASMEQQLSELDSKLEVCLQQSNELNAEKLKLQADNSDLLNRLKTLDDNNKSLLDNKTKLTGQVEEANSNLDREIKQNILTGQQLKKLAFDLEASKEQLEESDHLKFDLQKQLNRTNIELKQLRSKWESEGLVRSEEADGVKKKLSLKLNEADERFEQVLAKCNSLEMIKQRLQIEVEDLLIDVEQANANTLNMEKKQNQFEKLIAEWKQKCEDFSLELEMSKKESRQVMTDLMKLKLQYDEANETIETLRKENNNLADVIKDLMSQLTQSNQNAHDFEKAGKKLEMEKDQLNAGLKDAYDALDQEENKVLATQLELTQLRQKIDSILVDKVEEFDNLKRGHQRALDAIQTSLESEAKAKHEAIKYKKKLESDINELEMKLNNTVKVESDLNMKIKKQQQNINELQTLIDEEKSQKAEAKEAVATAEKRYNALVDEINEKKHALEHVEKSRKSIERDLNCTTERINELNSTNLNLSFQKKKFELEYAKLKAELDDALDEAKNSDNKLKKAYEDAGRLAEELRLEQEYAEDLEKSKRSLELMLKDMQSKLEETEKNSIKEGKRLTQKLEKRISDLEVEVELEQKRHQETAKELRRNERTIKELNFQTIEEKKKRESMQEQIESFQAKLKSYKKQIEETEEMAATNLSRFRRIQQKLEENNISEPYYPNLNRGKSEQRGYYGERASSILTYRV